MGQILYLTGGVHSIADTERLLGPGVYEAYIHNQRRAPRIDWFPGSVKGALALQQMTELIMNLPAGQILDESNPVLRNIDYTYTLAGKIALMRATLSDWQLDALEAGPVDGAFSISATVVKMERQTTQGVAERPIVNYPNPPPICILG